MMKPYFVMFHARARQLLQYRAAAIAGFGTQLFWGLMKVMVFTAFYHSSSATHPMTLQETVNYIWLGQAMLLLVPWNMDKGIAAMIQSGNVVYELIRPVNLYWFWFSRTIALRLAPVLLRATPMFVVAGLFLGLEAPASPEFFAAFLVTTFGALLLSTALTAAITFSMFWTVSGSGAARLVPSVVMLFSGHIVPLPLFPEWAQPLLNALPFRAIHDVPFRFYMGNLSLSELPGFALTQAAWTVAFVIVGQIILSRGLRRVVVQGG